MVHVLSVGRRFVLNCLMPSHWIMLFPTQPQLHLCPQISQARYKYRAAIHAFPTQVGLFRLSMYPTVYTRHPPSLVPSL